MYYQTEWDDSTEKTLVFSSKGSFILPLSARPNTLLPNLYAYMFVHTHVILPCCIFGPCLSVRVPLSPDRGLPLYPNSVLRVQPQISTKCPPLFIVGLIHSYKSCFVTFIQVFTLNFFNYIFSIWYSLTRSPCCCPFCNISRSSVYHSRPSVFPIN